MDAKVPLPVSFSEFSKEPVKAILFIALLAIGYLYVDSRIDKIMAEATAELRALKSIKQ
jgi:hypothetical protein